MAGWLNRQQVDLINYLCEENKVLREQLGGKPLRLTNARRRRLAVRGKRLGRRALIQVAGNVTPDTILRWYRKLIAKKYDGSVRRGRGRPTTPRQIAELVVRMAVENPKWGYTRIRGVLANLGHEIARKTVKRILQDHGIEPAPERGQRLHQRGMSQPSGPARRKPPSSISTSSTTIGRGITRDSVTDCWSGRHHRSIRTPKFKDTDVSVDSSTTTIARPHE